MTHIGQSPLRDQPANPGAIGQVGQVDLEQLTELVGRFADQLVRADPEFGAAAQLAQSENHAESVENMLEGGGGDVLLRKIAAKVRPSSTAMDKVAKPTKTEENRDENSATADDTVDRLAALRSLRNQAGGGGGGGAGDQQNQQQQQTLIRLQKGARDKADKLTAAINAIRAELLASPGADPTQLMARINNALNEFSTDSGTQLQALMEIGADPELSPPGSPVANMLGDVLQTLTARMTPTQMQAASRDIFLSALFRAEARLQDASDPGAQQDGASTLLRNTDPGKNAESLGKILAALRSPTTIDGFSDALMRAAGLELGTIQAGNREHLAAVLAEVAEIKLLNSLYDGAGDFFRASNLQETTTFNIRTLMSFVLQFVSNSAPEWVFINEFMLNALAQSYAQEREFRRRQAKRRSTDERDAGDERDRNRKAATAFDESGQPPPLAP